MLRKRLIPALAAAAFLPSALPAASFDEAADHLHLGGSLVAFLDFEGDGEAIGTELNTLYRDLQKANPAIPPIQLDFVQLIDHLGFGSVRGMGFSSKPLGDGRHLNRAITLLGEEPSGIFGVLPKGEAHRTRFTAARLAPANATGAMTLTLDLRPLRDTVNAIAGQIMGQAGEGFIQQNLARPVPDTDVTFGELIEGLSGKIDAYWKQDVTFDGSAPLRYHARLAGAGPLLARLRPLENRYPVTFTADSEGLTAEVRNPAGPSVFLIAPKDTGALHITSHPDWTAGKDGEALAETEIFQSITGQMPESALWFSFTRGTDLDAIMKGVRQIPGAAPYAGLARKAVDLLIGDFLEPSAGVGYVKEGVAFSDYYAGHSTKQTVMALPTMVAGGLGAAMAIPAFQKVRETSQEKTVTNNLRQLAAAADQYFLEEGKTKVRASELIGPDKYIRSLDPVAGETYEDLVITTEMDEISVTLADGTTVSIPF